MSSIFNGINEAARSPEPDYNDPSWDEKVSNVGQKAKQAEVLKSKGKEPKTRWNPETKKYYVDFSDVDESVGLPYPGTYEETNDMFKGSGQRRIGTLTTEEGVEGGSKEIPQWKKDWYAKQKPNSWPKHPQPYHNPNWIAELSPEQLKKLAGQKSVAEGDDPFRGTGGRFNRGDDERHDLDPTDWYIVKDGKMFAASIYPRQVQQAIAQGFSRTKQEARAKASSEGVAEGSQEDAKFTPRFEVRSRIEGALDQYLDPEQVAGGYTDIQYYKHDGRVYVEVLFNYTNGQKIGPTQRKRFLVNKDFTLTPIKRQQGVAEALTYPQKHSSWSVRSPKKNEFNTRYKLDQEPEARAHAERIGGKLVKVDQRGHAIRTGSKGDQGVAEGLKDKLAGAALAGSMAMGGAPAHAGFGADLAGSIASGLGSGVASAAMAPAIYKEKNAADKAFAEQIPDEADKAKYLKGLKYIMNSRSMANSGSYGMIQNTEDEIQFKKFKQRFAAKYNIQMPTKESVDEEKQRLDPKCWTGKHKEGTKMKGGVRVNNCVPNESSIMKGIKV